MPEKFFNLHIVITDKLPTQRSVLPTFQIKKQNYQSFDLDLILKSINCKTLGHFHRQMIDIKNEYLFLSRKYSKFLNNLQVTDMFEQFFTHVAN